MSTIDIRNMETSAVARIRFAEDKYATACFISNCDGRVYTEDQDQDGCSYRIDVEDVDNFVKARTHARSLGWAI